jgi:hypothetical protein
MVLGLTGSAPFTTIRSELRSSPATSALMIRFRQSSKAKFGAADSVARWRWMAQSHRAGSAMKASGDMMTAGAAK